MPLSNEQKNRIRKYLESVEGENCKQMIITLNKNRDNFEEFLVNVLEKPKGSIVKLVSSAISVTCVETEGTVDQCQSHFINQIVEKISIVSR